MLPGMDKKKEAGLIVASLGVPDVESKSDEGDDQIAYESMAHDVIKAVKMGDAKMLSSSLQAFFEMCDSEPHMEGPHSGSMG